MPFVTGVVMFTMLEKGLQGAWAGSSTASAMTQPPLRRSTPLPLCATSGVSNRYTQRPAPSRAGIIKTIGLVALGALTLLNSGVLASAEMTKDFVLVFPTPSWIGPSFPTHFYQQPSSSVSNEMPVVAEMPKRNPTISSNNHNPFKNLLKYATDKKKALKYIEDKVLGKTVSVDLEKQTLDYLQKDHPKKAFQFVKTLARRNSNKYTGLIVNYLEKAPVNEVTEIVVFLLKRTDRLNYSFNDEKPIDEVAVMKSCFYQYFCDRPLQDSVERALVLKPLIKEFLKQRLSISSEYGLGWYFAFLEEFHRFPESIQHIFYEGEAGMSTIIFTPLHHIIRDHLVWLINQPNANIEELVEKAELSQVAFSFKIEFLRLDDPRSKLIKEQMNAKMDFFEPDPSEYKREKDVEEQHCRCKREMSADELMRWEKQLQSLLEEAAESKRRHLDEKTADCWHQCRRRNYFEYKFRSQCEAEDDFKHCRATPIQALKNLFKAHYGIGISSTLAVALAAYILFDSSRYSQMPLEIVIRHGKLINEFVQDISAKDLLSQIYKELGAIPREYWEEFVQDCLKVRILIEQRKAEATLPILRLYKDMDKKKRAVLHDIIAAIPSVELRLNFIELMGSFRPEEKVQAFEMFAKYPQQNVFLILLLVLQKEDKEEKTPLQQAKILDQLKFLIAERNKPKPPKV